MFYYSTVLKNAVYLQCKMKKLFVLLQNYLKIKEYLNYSQINLFPFLWNTWSYTTFKATYTLKALTGWFLLTYVDKKNKETK